LSTRALVICPSLTRESNEALRSPEARREEAVGLARAIDLAVVGAESVALSAIRPATFIGKGKVETVAAQVKAEEIDLVVMDCALSPAQQRNLEKAFGCKVIDRTGLILEIFGQRARTAEGTLQVELAHLKYQRSRLVRSWTHLERQRGGFGFLGGPGETQIETDRRLIGERIVRIERELEAVKRRRALQRASRSDVPYPIVALVGYTNAGKSTLFNALSSADVLVSSRMFATLDPTIRAIRLPSNRRVLVSDTVGFIRDLPKGLLTAFRATLEEVQEAALILHVSDVSNPHHDELDEEVDKILQELGVADRPKLRVLNKMDLLAPQQRASLEGTATRVRENGPVLVSAMTGQAMDDLLGRIDAELPVDPMVSLSLRLPLAEGRTLALIHALGRVLHSAVEDSHMTMDAEVPASIARRLRLSQYAAGGTSRVSRA